MHSAIYCEGYQDRAFLSAWVDYLCEKRRISLSVLKDPKSRQINAGNAHAKQCGSRQLLIVACEGDGDITSNAATFLKTKTDLVDRLVVVVDADGLQGREESVLMSFESQVKKLAGC